MDTSFEDVLAWYFEHDFDLAMDRWDAYHKDEKSTDYSARFMIPGLAQFDATQSLGSHESISFDVCFSDPGIYLPDYEDPHCIDPEPFNPRWFPPLYPEGVFGEKDEHNWDRLEIEWDVDDRFMLFCANILRGETFAREKWTASLQDSTTRGRRVKINTASFSGYLGLGELRGYATKPGHPIPTLWVRFVRVVEILVESLAAVAAFRRSRTPLTEIPPQLDELIRLARLYLVQADYERLRDSERPTWANETKKHFHQGESGRARDAEGLQDWDAPGILDALWDKIQPILDRVNAIGRWEAVFWDLEDLSY